MKKILAIVLLGLLMTACCTQPIVKCKRPERPPQSQGSDEMAVMESLINYAVYALELEKTIKCYEQQQVR